MHLNAVAWKRIAERGPRYAVYRGLRAGQGVTDYYDTAPEAETAVERLRDEGGYYGIRIVPPDGAVDLVSLGQARAEARRAYDEATAVLRAGVLRALEEGFAEAGAARAAVVDRMTVRAWAGK